MRLLVGTLFLITALPMFGATIMIVNKDAPGVGFNDPTPAAPVGGNNGTTLGQQRLNAFQHAADIWGAKLSSPFVIRIAANFEPLTPCSPTSGVIGSAGTTAIVADFPNAPRAGTSYPVALASALAGIDYAAGAPDGASISASFNSAIGTADCLTNKSFYLGFDANEGPGGIDLVVTLLHEFGHGLGFAGFANLGSGAFFPIGITPVPDVFSVYTHDNLLGLNWNVMSNLQRVTSATSTDNVVFDGPGTTAAAVTLLSAGKDLMQHPKLFAPNPVVGGSSIYHFDKSATPNQLMEPVINSDLTHNVDVPNDLTTKALVDMGWRLQMTPPQNVVATATSPTNVAVSWSAVAGATYRVFRTSHTNSTMYSQIATGVTGTTFNDTTALPGRSYLYKVRAFDGVSESTDSNFDLATTVIFTDPSLAGATVKAAHFNELRTAADSVRALAGLGGGAYTDTLSAGVLVKSIHLADIRTALNLGLTMLALPSVADPAVVAGTPIQAAPIMALRAAVQ